MINAIRRLFIGCILLSLLCSCGKDNDPGPKLAPVSDHPLIGLLGTIGYGAANSHDTLVYKVTGTSYMSVFTPLEDFVNDKITLTPQTNGTWAIRRVNPRTSPSGLVYIYFGCDPINLTVGAKPNSGEFTDNFTCKHTLRETVTPDCEFILTRDDKNPRLIYLESKLYPGNYLTSGPRKWDNTLYQRYLLYSDARRAFFILPD